MSRAQRSPSTRAPLLCGTEGHSWDRKLLDRAAEALAAVLKFDAPADAVLSAYFRTHRALGQHDRGFVAESVFGVLRHKRTLDYLARTADPRRLLLAWAARFEGFSMAESLQLQPQVITYRLR